MTAVPPPDPNAASPKAPAFSILGAARHPVTRYRRQVVAAIGVLVGVVFLIALMIGFRPNTLPRRAEADGSKTVGAQPLSGPEFGSLPSSYSDPNGPLNQPPAPASLPSPSAGAPAAASSPEQLSPDEQQRRDLARSAASSSPFFGGGQNQGGAAAANPTALAGSGPETATTPAVAAAAPVADRALPASALQNMQAQKQDFIAGAAIKSDYLASPYERPISPFEVKAGSIIPAALVTGLNSDLPGEIIAQVTQPVFDHVTGRFLLIPQGARLIGRYDSNVAFGQDRALIVWNRIIMPDGRSINIGVMTGADLSGASGLTDQVDGHIGPVTRAIALSTAITVGGAVAQNAATRSSGNLVLNDAAGGVSEQASEVGGRFVDRELNRQPTIKVRPGWPLTVLVSRDLVLEPY